MNDRMVCQSCSQQRLELHVVKSVLLEGINLTLCKTCMNNGYEPRFIILIALAQNGITPNVKKMVEETKYIGSAITLSEYLSVDK